MADAPDPLSRFFGNITATLRRPWGGAIEFQATVERPASILSGPRGPVSGRDDLKGTATSQDLLRE